MRYTTARIVREVAHLRAGQPIRPPITRNGVLMTWTAAPANYIAPILRQIDHFLRLPHRKQTRAKAVRYWQVLAHRTKYPVDAGWCDFISHGAERMAKAAKIATERMAEAVRDAMAKAAKIKLPLAPTETAQP